MNARYLLVLFLFAATCAYAEPVYQAKNGGVLVTLHSDECALKGEITNLPRRATWEESGKTVEGCWGAWPKTGLVLFYFADKTALAIYIQEFERVTGI